MGYGAPMEDEVAAAPPRWPFTAVERSTLREAYDALTRVGNLTHDVARHGTDCGGWDPLLDRAHHDLGLLHVLWRDGTGRAPRLPGASDAALGLRSAADMAALPPDQPVHPAGVGSAPECLVRTLLSSVPASWQVYVDDLRWVGGVKEAAAGVIVRADPELETFSVWGWRPPLWPAGGRDASCRLELPRYGFTSAAADAVLQMLRGLQVLP